MQPTPPQKGRFECPLPTLQAWTVPLAEGLGRELSRSATIGSGPINAVPPSAGTYILEMRLEKRVTIAVGQLGRFTFARGWYLYVGSARGSGGLRGRIAHHLRDVRRPHWHIDYLRRAISIERIFFSPTRRNNECFWTHRLANLTSATYPVGRFGSSDCRCLSHLLYLGPRVAADQGFGDLIRS